MKLEPCILSLDFSAAAQMPAAAVDVGLPVLAVHAGSAGGGVEEYAQGLLVVAHSALDELAVGVVDLLRFVGEVTDLLP